MSGPKSILKTAAVVVALLPGLLVGCSTEATEPNGAPPESSEAKPTLPMTVTVDIEDGQSDVTLQSINWNATATDDEPDADYKFMTAMFKFENSTSGWFEPYRAFEYMYESADGTTYETSDATVEQDLFGTGGILPGESVEGNVVFEIPASTADDTGTFLLDVDGEVYSLPLDGSGPVMPTSEAPSSEPTTATSEPPATESPGETVELAADAEGDGPAVLDSPMMKLSIPAESRYEVSSYGYAADTGRGGITLYLRSSGYAYLTYEISTTRMVYSLDDAAAECARTNSANDTWTSERGADVVFNGVTYATVTMKQDPQEHVYYVTYYEKDGIDHYAEMEIPVKSFAFNIALDDPLVTYIMESIEYK